MWFSSRFPFLSVFNCTNTFICSVHTPTKCQEEEDKELPQQWKKRFIFPPLYSKWKPQWKFHILSLFLIETDAHWLRSLNMSLNSLNFQSCTVDVRQIFYFLQHREQQICPCFSKQSAVRLTDTDPIKCAIYWLSINGVLFYSCDTPLAVSHTFRLSRRHRNIPYV